MNIYIVIPAHNEGRFIGQTLQSLMSQTLQPTKIVVVDDQSTDDTSRIVSEIAEKHQFISLVRSSSSAGHLPGSKVIKAFYRGLETLDDKYDVICKFDGDLIFPKDYIQKVRSLFESDPKIGMAGGFCIVNKDGKWILENLTSPDHIRGALKAYRKECFDDIGGLKIAMGWDTADELLAQYHNWKIKTDSTLLVKHLKPTGTTYGKASKYKQGEAFYRLRYGLPITLIASAKLAHLKGNYNLAKDYLAGYYKAKREKQPFLVSAEEGRFIRNLRWEKMFRKIF